MLLINEICSVFVKNIMKSLKCDLLGRTDFGWQKVDIKLYQLRIFLLLQNMYIFL